MQRKKMEVVLGLSYGMGLLLIGAAITVYWSNGSNTIALWFLVGGMIWIVLTAGFQTQRFIWESERRAEKGPSEIEIKTLRAYVSLTVGEVRRLGIGQIPQIHIVFKNGGQTPAYDAITWDGVSLLDFPPTDSFAIDSTIETNRAGTIIGIGSEYHVVRDLPGALTEARFAALASGKFAIYGFGRLKYTDAFGIRRTTNYRLYYGGDKPLNDKGVMSVLPEGTNAD